VIMIGGILRISKEKSVSLVPKYPTSARNPTQNALTAVISVTLEKKLVLASALKKIMNVISDM